MRQLRKKTIVILFIAFVISIIIIWYRAPVERSISTSLCSVDGERIDVVFNLSWHKYIFSPTEIRGTIKLYNDTYYYINDTNIKMDKGSFLDRLANKLKNNMPTPWYIIPTNNALDIHYNNINVCSIDKNFRNICILVKKGNSFNEYYGPAETVEEAELIRSRLYK